MQLRSCILGVAVCSLLGAVIPGLVYAAAPPLQANEEIVKTADGCGMVIDKTSTSAVYVREAYSKLTWGGACVDGLAMGEGILSPGFKTPDQPGMLPMTGWVWYGRSFGPSETRWENGSIQKNFRWESKWVSYSTLDSSKAVWSKTVADASRVNDGEMIVSTMVLDKPVVSVSPMNDFSKTTQHPCPKNKKSPAGCEKLWLQHAGPVIERIKAFLAEHEPKAQERMAEVQLLVAQWKAKVGPAVVAKREADARRAAGEQYDKDAKQAEWDKGCWDKINKGPSGFDFTSEGYTKRAAYLRNLFKGECAGHHYEAEGLKEADRLLAEVPKLQKDEAEAAKYKAEEKAQSEKDKQEIAGLFGKVAGAVAGGASSEERKQAVMNVLNEYGQDGSGAVGAGRINGEAGADGAGAADTGVAREIGPTPEVTRTQEVINAAAEIESERNPNDTLCHAAINQWMELQMPTDEGVREKYGVEFPGSNDRTQYEMIRFKIEFLRKCAKDQQEFQEVAKYELDDFEFWRPMIEPCRDGYRIEKVAIVGDMRKKCDGIPPGFDEWFARYQHNASVALEWARTAKPPAPPTPQENACQKEIFRWEMLKRDRESKIAKDSIVRLSEINMWFMQRSMDTIERLCPDSPRYRAEYDLAKKTLPEMMRACSESASNPPCVARLDEDSKPAPQPSSVGTQAPPLAAPPQDSGPKSGASWVKSTVDTCRAEGGEPVVDECIRCDNPGRGWTKCPAGSSGVDSMQ